MHFCKYIRELCLNIFEETYAKEKQKTPVASVVLALKSSQLSSQKTRISVFAVMKLR